MRPIRSIYCYPIKGLSAQPQRGVELEAGKPFPFDRIYALARPGAPIDLVEPKWAKKGQFVMLMLDDALARVQTHLDLQTLRLDITRDGKPVLGADLATPSGRDAVEAYFGELVPRLGGAPRLVRAGTGHFMDKPENVVSLINLATVRSLEEKWGRAVDPLRFRANFYIDGEQPWEEFDWIGSDILLGDAVLHVERRNGRCGATNVNPATGQRDMDIPGALRNAYGHKDLGVYLLVRKPGKVVVGDALLAPEPDAPALAPSQGAATAAVSPPAPIAPGPRRHICRGCYFVYDETQGHPQSGITAGTAFSAIAPQWRCPDCGTQKATFRPHV
jgi:GntR family transcriptional regulator/MocR family aminotransferase